MSQSRRADLTLIWHSVFSIGARGAGAVISFLFSWLVARHFGARGSGVLALGQTLAVVVSSTALLGLDFTLARLIVLSVEEGRRGAVKALTRYALTGPVLSVVAVSAFVFLLGGRLYSDLVRSEDLKGQIWILFFGSIGLGQLIMTSQILRVLGYFKLSQLSIGVLSASLSIAILVILRTGFHIADLSVPIIAYSGGPLLAAAITGWWCWRSVALVPTEPLHSAKWPLVRQSLPFAAAQGLNFGVDWIIIAILGRVVDIEGAGIFRICYLVGTIFFLISSGAELAGATPLCSAWNAGDRRRVNRVMWTLRLATFGSALPLALAILIYREPILGYFGPDFVAGSGAIAILIAGQLVNIATGPVGALLTAAAANRATLAASVSCAVVGLAVAAMAVPAWGIAGAAAASAASIVVRSGTSLWLGHRKLRSLG